MTLHRASTALHPRRNLNATATANYSRANQPVSFSIKLSRTAQAMLQRHQVATLTPTGWFLAAHQPAITATQQHIYLTGP
jgi:hypothetical protein